MLCDLDRELHLGRLARHLRPVVKIDDPHARHFAYRRAGAGTVAARDDFRAADIVRAQRRALLAPVPPCTAARAVPTPAAPSPDDLVALMAEALVRAVRFDSLDLDDDLAVETGLITAGFAALDAGRPDIVEPATARARAALRSRARLDHAADGAAFATLILVWTAGYALLCPPAHAATRAAAFLTDERLGVFFTWAPLAMVGLLLLAFCWRDRGQPWIGDEDPEAPVLLSSDLDDRRRAADRG